MCVVGFVCIEQSFKQQQYLKWSGIEGKNLFPQSPPVYISTATCHAALLFINSFLRHLYAAPLGQLAGNPPPTRRVAD